MKCPFKLQLSTNSNSGKLFSVISLLFISLTFLSILNEVTFKYEILDDLNELIEDRIKYYYENNFV